MVREKFPEREFVVLFVERTSMFPLLIFPTFFHPFRSTVPFNSDAGEGNGSFRN